jgi:chromosome partitioning protein
MILTIGSTKGGTGKTTLALQLALARTLAGNDVLLIDGDRQGTAQTAVAMRADAGRMPGLACSHYPDERVLRAQVQQQASKYTDVLIDAGGRDSAALRMALVLSDAVLVPVPPRSFDVWAVQDIAKLIEGAQDARADRGAPPLRCMAVLSMADPGASPDNAGAIEALADLPQLMWLEPPIRRRKAFSNASGLGLSVTELVPRDDKACAELAALVRNVFDVRPTLDANGEALHDHCETARAAG